MKRNLELTLEQARELYKNDPMKELLLTTFTKEELEGSGRVMRWEELKEVSGYMIDEESQIQGGVTGNTKHKDNKAIFRTEKQAKSALAMAQLSHLIWEANGREELDWTNDKTKYSIDKCENQIQKTIYSRMYYTHMYRFLSFKTPEIRDKFYEVNKDLVHDYLMID